MKARHLLPLLAAALISASCGGDLDMLGMFWTRSETPDQRFDQSMAYNASRGPVVVNVPEDDYSVYLFTDSHVEGSTVNLDRFIDDYLGDTGTAPFCLFLGDAIDCTDNYDLFYDHIGRILDSPRDTIFCTPGNHDIYFDQWQAWASRFKTSSYTFEVLTHRGKDFYLSFDSSSGKLGGKQLKWVRETLESASGAGYRHITVFTHTHFFKKDASQGHTSNYELEETYELLGLFSRCGVDIVLTGHDHSREDTRFGGVDYYVFDAILDGCDSPSYAKLRYGAEGIHVEYIPVNE